MLGRHKYIQQNHWCLSRVPWRLNGYRKVKRHKSPSTDQIPAELIKAGGRKSCSEYSYLIKFILNKKELPKEWKESICIPVYKKGDKTNCSNIRGIPLLSTTYKILSNILL